MSAVLIAVNNMAESMSIDDFKRWKVNVLRKYCQQRGLTTVSSKRKDELVALAYAAYSQNLPVVSSKEEEKSEAKQQYTDLLTLQDGTKIPDPFGLPATEWMSEAVGLQRWPPCMICNISEYLVSRNERPLCSRLGNDYKEGAYCDSMAVTCCALCNFSNSFLTRCTLMLLYYI